MNSPSTTIKRLLGCLQFDDPDTRLARLQSYSPPDWEAVLDQAHARGVMPLLAGRLLSMGPALNLPAGVQQRLKSLRLQAAGRNVRLYHYLEQLLLRMNAGDISVIVLKGAHLAELVYPDIAMRPMGDIDLLVQTDDLRRCNDLLCEAGYGPSRLPWIERNYAHVHHHLPPYSRPGSTPIEMHWSIAHPKHSVTVDLDGLWQRAQPARLGQADVLTLAPEDLLLHLCLHLSYHDHFHAGLRNLVDIAQVIEHYQAQIDWTQVLQRARQWQMQRGAFLCLEAAYSLLGAKVPAGILAQLQPSDYDPQLPGVVQEITFDGTQISDNFSRLWAPGPRWGKARLLIQRIFPSPDALTLKKPVQPTSPLIIYYYLKRLRSLLVRYSRAAGSLLRHDSPESAALRRENLLAGWLEPDR